MLQHSEEVTTGQGKCPRRVDVVVVNDDDQSPSILNPMSGQIFLTNQVGKLIFNLADGSRGMDEIANEVRSVYAGADSDRVRQDVDAFVEEAVTRGLLSWQTPAVGR